MPLTTTRVTGRISLPDDISPSQAHVAFTLLRYDTDAADDVTIIPDVVRAAIDVAGDIDVDLWPNARGERETYYSVSVVVQGETRARTFAVGFAVVPSGGTVDLNDILAVAPPPGANVNDYIAQLSAAVAGAQSNAEAAEASAARVDLGALDDAEASAVTAEASAVAAEAFDPAMYLARADNLTGLGDAGIALTNLGAAPIESPDLTGVPTAPTAAVDTDTTQIATTAYVMARKISGSGTPVAVDGLVTTSFAIPAGVQEIVVNFVGVSTDRFISGGSLGVRVGPVGGVNTSGYVSNSAKANNDDTIIVKSRTDQFVLEDVSSGNAAHGSMVIRRLGTASNTWISTHAARVSDLESVTGGGSVSLSGELTTVEIGPYNGSDEFDAGTINVTWTY